MKIPVNFTACKYLDFEEKFPQCKKEILSGKQETVFWLRKNSEPSMVLFCKKRGRLNQPDVCLCKNTAMCADFKIKEHTIYVE